MTARPSKAAVAGSGAGLYVTSRSEPEPSGVAERLKLLAESGGPLYPEELSTNAPLLMYPCSVASAVEVVAITKDWPADGVGAVVLVPSLPLATTIVNGMVAEAVEESPFNASRSQPVPADAVGSASFQTYDPPPLNAVLPLTVSLPAVSLADAPLPAVIVPPFWTVTALVTVPFPRACHCRQSCCRRP